MAGTRTAPTVADTGQTTVGITLHLIDASGDQTTDYIVAESLDTADIEAHVVAYQATSNASVWKVTIGLEFEGEADPDNAVVAFRAEIQNGINLLFKDVSAQKKQTPRVVAPVVGIMQASQDIPLLVSPLTTLVSSYLTLLGGAYAQDSMQYTARRERSNNPRIST